MRLKKVKNRGSGDIHRLTCKAVARAGDNGKLRLILSISPDDFINITSFH